MEFVPGGHFENQIRERGKIPEIEMLPLAIEVALGLKAAHSAGLIHRDVKPGNILLDAEGHAKLVDFGLALVTHGGKAQATELWATPYYVPPETVEGHPEDFRSDIYAFGATIYHALAGKPPCGEESMATDVLREAKKRVVPLSKAAPFISAETCRIVERAMAYSAPQRYDSYEELITHMGNAHARLKTGRVESSGVVVARQRAEKKRQERRVVTAAVAALIVIAAAVGLVGALKKDPGTDQGQAPPVAQPDGPAIPAYDGSSETAKIYREAHEALAARKYHDAKMGFLNLLQNPLVQEPTRTWAGVEAVLASFLEGKPSEARQMAKSTASHLRGLPADAPGIGPILPGMLERTADFRVLSPPQAGGISEDLRTTVEDSLVLAHMLAGLKNWEQGMPDAAKPHFEFVARAKLADEDSRVAVYQKIAADYLADYQVLNGPLFQQEPADPAACAKRIGELEGALAGMKTLGRARFNVRAWQSDLKRRSNQPAEPTVKPPTPPAPVVEEQRELTARLEKLARTYRFSEALAEVKSSVGEAPRELLASLLAVTGSAAGFLADLEQDLKKGPVNEPLAMRSGATATGISINPAGGLQAILADGTTVPCQWADFQPDALVALHRVLVKNPASEQERLRRHECAIAFDWLAGNRERALTAAANLSQISETFRKRWQEISAGLPN
jgi:eukaryotic-like serine/threonine-protein kinase